jgi:hypothetical protein
MRSATRQLITAFGPAELEMGAGGAESGEEIAALRWLPWITREL